MEFFPYPGVFPSGIRFRRILGEMSIRSIFYVISAGWLINIRLARVDKARITFLNEVVPRLRISLVHRG